MLQRVGTNGRIKSLGGKKKINATAKNQMGILEPKNVITKIKPHWNGSGAEWR